MRREIERGREEVKIAMPSDAPMLNLEGPQPNPDNGVKLTAADVRKIMTDRGSPIDMLQKYKDMPSLQDVDLLDIDSLVLDNEDTWLYSPNASFDLDVSSADKSPYVWMREEFDKCDSTVKRGSLIYQLQQIGRGSGLLNKGSRLSGELLLSSLASSIPSSLSSSGGPSRHSPSPKLPDRVQRNDRQQSPSPSRITSAGTSRIRNVTRSRSREEPKLSSENEPEEKDMELMIGGKKPQNPAVIGLLRPKQIVKPMREPVEYEDSNEDNLNDKMGDGIDNVAIGDDQDISSTVLKYRQILNKSKQSASQESANGSEPSSNLLRAGRNKAPANNNRHSLNTVGGNACEESEESDLSYSEQKMQSLVSKATSLNQIASSIDTHTFKRPKKNTISTILSRARQQKNSEEVMGSPRSSIISEVIAAELAAINDNEEVPAQQTTSDPSPRGGKWAVRRNDGVSPPVGSQSHPDSESMEGLRRNIAGVEDVQNLARMQEASLRQDYKTPLRSSQKALLRGLNVSTDRLDDGQQNGSAFNHGHRVTNGEAAVSTTSLNSGVSSDSGSPGNSTQNLNRTFNTNTFNRAQAHQRSLPNIAQSANLNMAPVYQQSLGTQTSMSPATYDHRATFRVRKSPVKKIETRTRESSPAADEMVNVESRGQGRSGIPMTAPRKTSSGIPTVSEIPQASGIPTASGIARPVGTRTVSRIAVRTTSSSKIQSPRQTNRATGRTAASVSRQNFSTTMQNDANWKEGCF